MRRSRKDKLRTTKKILIICEGATEQSYINHLLNESDLMTSNIAIECADGGGYSNISNYVDRNMTLFSVILVICDLDRAEHKTVEKQNLKLLIRMLEKTNLENNTFLSCPSIEVWIAASIGECHDRLKSLGYVKGNTVGRFLRNRGGTYANACNYLSDASMYYVKRGFRKGIFYENAITSAHSNLIYFIDYMNVILRK